MVKERMSRMDSTLPEGMESGNVKDKEEILYEASFCTCTEKT